VHWTSSVQLSISRPVDPCIRKRSERSAMSLQEQPSQATTSCRRPS